MSHPQDHRPEAILMDMDGVLYHGEQPLPGAAAFIAAIAGIPHAYITNNPVLPPEAIAQKLARLNIAHADPRRIVTSAQATAEWLARQKPGFRYFAVGAEGLHHALQAKGVADSKQADFVVIGEGAGLDYVSLTIGINLILKYDAQLVCTNPDISVDSVQNQQSVVLPGGGALVAPFAVATGTKPIMIGKPAAQLYEMALERLNVRPEQCVMIGDRPDTDILGAQNLGMKTALVRTGRFLKDKKLPENIQPDWDVDSLEALLACWTGASLVMKSG